MGKQLELTKEQMTSIEERLHEYSDCIKKDTSPAKCLVCDAFRMRGSLSCGDCPLSFINHGIVFNGKNRCPASQCMTLTRLYVDLLPDRNSLLERHDEIVACLDACGYEYK